MVALLALASCVGASTRWKTYHDPLGWFLRYPASWRVQPFHLEMFRWGDEQGALVGNLDREVHRKGQTTGWDLRGLPPGFVVVLFQRYTYGAGPKLPPTPPRPYTRFPLSFDDAQPSSPRAFGVSRSLAIDVVPRGRGGSWTVWVWFGSKVSQEDRAIAKRIVASVRFARS
ncbi:MAG: hypothetical protein HY775_01020 [Acidobacteria bacterium]|nr:hypothetical protein [Acidobacteriota bacterium]